MKEKYTQLSPSEFFYRNREVAGFSNPVRAVYQTIRELVENALDATETHGILPNIKISVKADPEDNEKLTITVEDNGVGILANEVPNVFGRVFYGSKYVLRQTRGIFGLGVKMAVLYAQLTTGQPVKITTSTRKSRFTYRYELSIDVERNMPLIRSLEILSNKEGWHGTRVELTIRGSWSQASKRVEEYIRRTALIAPYAQIEFEDAEGGKLTFDRGSQNLPQTPLVGKPHPRGVDVIMLTRMIRRSKKGTTIEKFLSSHFDGVGSKTAAVFCSWAGIDPSKEVQTLTMDEIEYLATKMQEYGGWRRPRPVTLSPLGEGLLAEGIKHVLNPRFVTAVSRPPSSYAGHPFIVEVALAYGGDIQPVEEPLLYRYANRIPLLYDESVDVARKVLQRINWDVYKVKFPAPMAVIVHICSTKVPFKGVGKEAVADVPEVEKEVEIGIRECARRLRRFLSRAERMLLIKRWELTIRRYAEEVTDSLSYIVGVDRDSIKRLLEELIAERIESRGKVKEVVAER